MDFYKMDSSNRKGDHATPDYEGIVLFVTDRRMFRDRPERRQLLAEFIVEQRENYETYRRCDHADTEYETRIDEVD